MIDSNSENDNNSTCSRDIDRYYPIKIIKNSHLQLSFIPSSHSSIKIAIWKDERIEHLDISKDLMEILHINGFTIESILEYGPSKIAEVLGIDEYHAKIIFNEATKGLTS